VNSSKEAQDVSPSEDEGKMRIWEEGGAIEKKKNEQM
jgi:hypothetical protein